MLIVERNMLKSQTEQKANKKSGDNNGEEIDLSKLKGKIETSSHAHNWYQRGPYLVCTSCKVKHATYVGLTKVVTQVKKSGEVVLEDLS